MNVNEEFYSNQHPGQIDYWNKMAAPRFRVRTFIRLLRTQHPFPGRLVDLGCGNGTLLREIGRHYSLLRLAGIDLAKPQIESNRRDMPEIEWYTADLCRPDPLPQKLHHAYDAVTASEIIEHLDDPRQFLQNALRLVKPEGGTLYLSTQSGPLGMTEKRVGHVKHYSRDEMSELLRVSGWRPLKVWNAGFPFHDFSKKLANIRPDATLKRFGHKPYGPLERLVSWGLRIAFKFNSSRNGAQLFAVAAADPNVQTN